MRTKPLKKKATEPRSWYAEYWSTNGKCLIGAVLRSKSSRYQAEEDALCYLIQVVTLNNADIEHCRGEVKPSFEYPEILYHCEGAAATAIGCRCSMCKEVVTLKFACQCVGKPRAKPVEEKEDAEKT